jgi:chaperonin cofactor prefoldin
MLRDGMFFSKSRTKFFDFILPIVPVIDSKNSENKLIEILSKVQHSPDKKVISKISLYIDDMRLLKNIVNEYIVYQNIVAIEELNLDKNKLFSLIVLKNIFPNEFDLLQEDKGYIYNIFKKVGDYRELIKSELDERLESISKTISTIENRIYESQFEAMAVMIPADLRKNTFDGKTWSQTLREWSKEKDKYIPIQHGGYGSSFTYNQFLEKFITVKDEYKEVLNRFKDANQKPISALKIEFQEIKKKKSRVNISSIKELLASMDFDTREKVFSLELETSNSNDNFSVYNNNIFKDHYFPLIKFLILEGLLDETYWHYKGCFYTGSLGKNDTIYMKNLLEGKEQDVFMELENPIEIIDRLEKSDFVRNNILNTKILELCLMNRDKEKVLAIISTTAESLENMKKLIDILDSYNFERIKQFVEILFENKIDYLEMLMANTLENFEDLFRKILLSIFTMDNATGERLSLFNDYIENNESIIFYVSEEDEKMFYKNLESSNAKLSDLSSIDYNRKSVISIEGVEKIKAYKLNVPNVGFIIKTLMGRDINYSNWLTVLYSAEVLSSSKSYVEENFVQFIEEYIDSKPNDTFFSNGEKEIVCIMNSELSINYKVEYLKYNSVTIKNINTLIENPDSETLLKEIFITNKIEFTSENLSLYWKSISQYPVEFVAYVNDNLTKENSEKVLQENISIVNALINSENVSDGSFDIIINYANSHINKLNKNISESRVCSLIKKGLLAVTQENIKTLFSNKYRSAIVKFAESEHQNNLIEMILGNQELLQYVDAAVIYDFAGSGVAQENVIRLIESTSNELQVANIPYEKIDIVKSILEAGLSKENANSIVDTFSTFPLKDRFLEILEGDIGCSVISDEHLNDEFISFVLDSKSVSIDVKVELLIRKIKLKDTEVENIKNYLSKTDYIKGLETVFDNRHPTLDNEYKEMVGDALIERGLVQKRRDGKLMLRKSKLVV